MFGVGIGIFLCQIQRDGSQVLIRLPDRCAGFHPSDDAQEMHAPIAGAWILIIRIIVHRQRGPNAVRWRTDRKPEGPWHDSDDGIKITAEANCTPDDRLVGGELRLPQRVADENHSRSKFLFIRSESAAEFRTDPE